MHVGSSGHHEDLLLRWQATFMFVMSEPSY